MSISHIIDTVCAYLNSVTSFFSTLQRLKNEFHTNGIDYSALVLKLLTQPRVDVANLGSSFDITARYQEILLASLVSLTVYARETSPDWTTQITVILKSRLPCSYKDPWRRGRLRPVAIDLHESHYIRTSKAKVFLAVYKPLQCIVLSLPGTNSRSDWLANLHSTNTDLEIDGSKIKVHQGFLYIAQCLFTHQSIHKYLADAIDAGFTKILLCGHSQAGAVVSLLSVLLKTEYPLESRIITFGSGACFQASNIVGHSCTSFVRCVSSSSTGIWHVDPVPLLDDAILSEEKHTIMYPGGQITTLLDHSTGCEARVLGSAQWRSLLTGVLLNFTADPHSMKGYVRCILMAAPVADFANDEAIEDEFLSLMEPEEFESIDDTEPESKPNEEK